MDVEQAVADFAASDWIFSRTDLETALSDLLIVFIKSDADVSFLLNALACSNQGLLEAVLTSGNRNASKFRTRVLKEARQPSSVEAPAFRTTVERLGAFLLDIPEGFTVDRTITEPFNALMNTIRALNSPESQPSGNTPNREQAKAGKKKQRNSQVQGSNKKDASSLVKASEQTTKFFENFFEHCTEGAIEQFALNNLLHIMSRNLQPPSSLEPKQREPSSPIAEKSPTDGRARSNSLQSEYLPLGFDEIAKQLESTASFKSGDWQVVVSQRAIKHIKQFASDKSNMSLLIEKKIKQLSVGYFPAPNQTNLLSRDFGVPIYTADVNEELRLIYHIDVGSPTSSGQETQFIRIFDMQPKSKIITAFWRSVATQLARRGSDYIKRCSERAETRIRFKRVETTPPKVYPSMITSELKDAQWQGGADVETNEEHSLELHRILALEKFIPFLQTFFDAIQKHDETNFVFAVSSTENQIINHHSSCIVLGRSGTGKTTCLLFRMLALDIAAEKCGRPVRQMFITQSLKLANQVRSQFLQMRQTVAPSPSLPAAQRSGLSLKELEEKTAEGALPAKFSQLDDSHFPLFLTFDQLCKLLEADYDLYFKPSNLPATEDARLEGSSESKRGPLISFDYFQAKIWPRFERLKKGLHPTLVYNEFMGVIKGSEACLKLQKPYLDRESRSYSHPFHLPVLKSLCPNPHGLFFAGDTAQTISAGSTFRFSELKSVLYSLERQDVNVKRGARKPVDPYFFQLSTNYRSHSGIVDAAAFIVSLIDSYFPHSIDSLAPEVSVVDVSAHKPTFFSGRGYFSDLLRFISYNRGGLGAQQVIIVRDEEASQRLQESIGTAAIVLTLYESKGMEFDDVLLYDFFSDSPATATDWRGLLRAQQENKTFDERRHSILQSELKSLYVGLTRARERVWVWDSSEKGRDMEELLVSATIVTSYAMWETVPQVGVSSSLEEWRDRGQQFFVDKLFYEAALCFTKAKLDWWTTVARTYYDRQLAVRLAEDGEQPVAEFARIAQEFEALAGSVEHAYSEEDSCVLFANAAECFATIPDHKAAADAFFKAERYTESASHYHSAGLLDRAIEIVARHPVNEEVSGVVKYAAKIAYAKRSDVASLHKAWKLCDNKDEFIKFLEDHGFEEQEIAFLESVGDYTHAGQLLWDRGDHLSALLQFRRSKTLLSRSKAAKCLLEALRANIPLGASFEEPFQPLLHLFSLCDDTEFSDSQRAEVDLLQAVATLDSEELEMHGMRCHKSGDDRGVVLALYSWASSDGLLALESESDERVEEILTLYHALDQAISSLAEWPRIDDLPFQQLFGISGTGKARYTSEDDLTVHPDSFIYSHVLVMRGGYRYLDLIDEPNFVTAPKYAIEELVRTKLLSQLRSALDSVEMIAKKSRAFDLCSPFTNTGKCVAAGQGHCWRDHIRANEFTIQRFNMKLRLLFLLIRVLDLSAPDMDEFEAGRNHALKQRVWLARLFKLCYPPSRRLGNISDITPALIPGYQEAIQIVKTWLREVFESLTPSDQPRFFLTHLLLTSLLATAFDYTEAQSYLWEGQWSLDTDGAAQDGLLHPTNHTPLATFVVVWLAGVTPTGGVEFLAHVLEGQVWLDAEVAVSFVEEVCAQLILNAYTHDTGGYHGLTMPRSWITRAFFRGPSSEPNESLPWRLVSVIGKFMDVLLLREYSGRFLLEGVPLDLASMGTRNQSISRLCRCLALVGQNIQSDSLRTNILEVLQRLPYFPSWPGISEYGTASTWKDVVAAMGSASNRLDTDEIVTISQKEGTLRNAASGRTIFCPDVKNIFKRLAVTPHPSAITSHTATRYQALMEKVLESQERRRMSEHAIPAEPTPPRWTPEEERAATIIQASFRRYTGRRPAGGVTAAEFETLAKRRIAADELLPPDRHWLICIRGPLPHVFQYLQRLQEASDNAVSAFDMVKELSEYEDLEEVGTKWSEIRALRSRVTELIDLLHPSSDFHCASTSGTIFSILDIVNQARLIPGLVSSIRNFGPCPEDDDYALGVEPLLSDRVPWTQLEWNQPGRKRRRRRGTRSAPLA